MGTWRRSGVVVESSVAPLNVFTGVARPSRLWASDGVTSKQLAHFDGVGADIATATGQSTCADGDIFETTVYARGNETMLMISTAHTPTSSMWELFINGLVDPVWRTIDESGKAFLDDGGVFTDDTVDAGDAGAGDCPLMPAVEAINDAFYFGWGGRFRGIRIDIFDPGVGATGDINWEYYNGGAWVVVPGIVDGTNLFKAAAGNHDVTFTPPSDWAAVAVNGVTMYWIRARVSVAGYTTIPIADQIWINGGYDDYNAADGVTDRSITLTQKINPGYNLISMKVIGKNVTSTNYWITIGGMSIQ